MFLCRAANGRVDELVQAEPPEGQAYARVMIALGQEYYRDELALIGQLRADLIAEARQRGLPPEAATQEAMEALSQAFFLATKLPPPVPGVRYTYRDIRARVEQKLRIFGPLPEADPSEWCLALALLVFEPSRLSLLLKRREPLPMGRDAETAIAKLRQLFADEIDLLRWETTRLARATRKLSHRALERLLTRRINREFVGVR